MRKFSALLFGAVLLLSGCSTPNSETSSPSSTHSLVSEEKTSSCSDQKTSTSSASTTVAESTEENRASVLDQLGALSDQSSAKEVNAAFNALISHTATAYDYCFQIDQLRSSQVPETDNERQFILKTKTADKILSCYLEGTTLYEVTRNAPSGISDAYVALVKMDASSTTAVSANFDGGEYTTPNPTLTLKNVLPGKEEDTSNLSDEQIRQNLIANETQLFSSMFGNALPIAPYKNPDFYTFELTPDGDGYLFTVQAKNLNTYNQVLDRQKDRTDLFETGNYIADSYQTTRAELTFHLDNQGAIEKALLDLEETFVYDGQTYTAVTSRSDTLKKIDGPAAMDFLNSLFEKIQNETLTAGSSFTLDLPLAG